MNLCSYRSQILHDRDFPRWMPGRSVDHDDGSCVRNDGEKQMHGPRWYGYYYLISSFNFVQQLFSKGNHKGFLIDFPTIMLADDLGCSTDALSVLDKACTNKHSCEYLIPSELVLISCSKEIASMYLTASYECYEGKQYKASVCILCKQSLNS